MSNKNRPVRHKLSRIIFMKFFTALILYSIGLVLSLFWARMFFGLFIWHRTSNLYWFLKDLDNNRILIILFLWVIGAVIIFLVYWQKTLGYIDVMLEAGKQLVAEDDTLIHLPGELREVENQMNQVKQEALRNARLIKESERRKNDLIVYLAHDLKTPLTSVIGYLTLLRDEQHISDELKARYLAIALSRSERLEDLINEFFEITRFNLSNLSLELSRVNMTRMLEQIVYEFKPLLDEKNLRCNLDIDQNLDIRCDVPKIERVLDNLIRNAINYSFEDSTLFISAKKKSSSTQLKFKNSGNTIPTEKLNRIFEQFFRLDAARTSKTGGAGLGLAIAKEIVELHQGTIIAHSQNESIEFIIDLPFL
ncbi:sensor histidine kinase [Cellulosilyticum sp. I15G10I2]|uniref:sensor histidine kinase n=1 Tax=Cellulosilyticum sp. I15G10I2 TaxID=1892843 RepID=UPI00085C2CE8|nr:HAMP domain-containing sensor histidine kinase [Cellulosilyticum sp. I15G10I2]